MSAPESTPPADPLAPEELKKALKAFKKRLKLTRLDDESRLGYGPMSGGGKSGVTAVAPPNQYPPEVWKELARQGRIRPAGNGLFELGNP
jgi:hypothetical protein